MYSAKKITDLIVSDIKDNLTSDYNFTIENYYGIALADFDSFFTKTRSIYVLYQGCDFEILSNNSLTGNMKILFVIIEQNIGTANKDRYFLDDVRDFLTWHNFTGILTEYPTDNFRPFFPSNESLYFYDETKGRAIWTIEGNITFDKHNISST